MLLKNWIFNIEILNQKQENLFSNLLTESITVFWTNGLIVFFLLFCIGLTGILFNYRNYLLTLLCIETMYLGLTLCFLVIGLTICDLKGQIYGLSLIIIAAAESAIGLGLLIVLFRFGGSIFFSKYQKLKG